VGGEDDAVLSQVDAIADTQQLIRLLTESHPDPYLHTDGPIGFHRHAEEILSAIPQGGISRRGLVDLLCPLVARLRDGHTAIFLPGSEPGAPEKTDRPLLPLEFDPVEHQLVVGAVYQQDDRRLLGARLRAVDGVDFADLTGRMEQLRGADNEYANLVHLAETLADAGLAAALFSNVPDTLTLNLELPDGSHVSRRVRYAPGPLGEPIEPDSAVTLPSLAASDIGWGFLGDDRAIACLRIASLVRYREAFEISRRVGNRRMLDMYLAEVAGAATGGSPPDDVDEAIATVPSAAEQLLELFRSMRDAGTETLLVDLRENRGGNSFFAAILAYYLHGVEAAAELDLGYQVLRYSPLYLANYLTPPEDRRMAIEAAMGNGGYDFSEEREWRRRQRHGLSPEERARAIADTEAEVATAPSFERFFQHREGEAMWSPRVIVLTSARTYSAGFDVAAMLVKRGARLVGVPSSQAGNCFIDGLFFTLENSRLLGSISFKWSRLFPEDPERGTVLRPDVELTYDYLRSTGFDPNAAVLLALEDVRRPA
jgi:hypothetical protein